MIFRTQPSLMPSSFWLRHGSAAGASQPWATLRNHLRSSQRVQEKLSNLDFPRTLLTLERSYAWLSRASSANLARRLCKIVRVRRGFGFGGRQPFREIYFMRAYSGWVAVAVVTFALVFIRFGWVVGVGILAGFGILIVAEFRRGGPPPPGGPHPPGGDGMGGVNASLVPKTPVRSGSNRADIPRD
jgi:hypothetical protein